MNINDDIDESILKDNFKDYDQISPNLRLEVAQAINNDLLKGFPDKTFRPLEPVTRGQVATLLYRILKNSYTAGSQEVEIDVELPEITYTSSLRVQGKITKGASLKINGEECSVKKDGSIDVELVF